MIYICDIDIGPMLGWGKAELKEVQPPPCCQVFSKSDMAFYITADLTL
jgi:hypothetical protein